MHRRESSRNHLSISRLLVASTILMAGLSGARAANVSGVIRTSSGGFPVSRARVILFDPSLTTFLESRSDGSGHYRIQAPAGTYRLGVAAVDLEYQETPLTLSGDPLQRDFV